MSSDVSSTAIGSRGMQPYQLRPSAALVVMPADHPPQAARHAGWLHVARGSTTLQPCMTCMTASASTDGEFIATYLRVPPTSCRQ
jgi:hypothetical protein